MTEKLNIVYFKDLSMESIKNITNMDFYNADKIIVKMTKFKDKDVKKAILKYTLSWLEGLFFDRYNDDLLEALKLLSKMLDNDEGEKDAEVGEYLVFKQKQLYGMKKLVYRGYKNPKSAYLNPNADIEVVYLK